MKKNMGRKEINAKCEEIAAKAMAQGKMPKYDKETLELFRQYTGEGGMKGADATKGGALNEYYTPHEVCEVMFKLARLNGYNGGSVLEPSVGIGNMLKPIYDFNPKAEVDAFELNPTSAHICKALYPRVNVHNQMFETAFLTPPRYASVAKESWLKKRYQLIIGNPPYGTHTNRYSSFFKSKKLEEFFVWKGMDLLDEGGLMVYILPISFLSSTPGSYDKWDMAALELVDAYRLPPVFKDTNICTDIIVAHKVK